ncbi:MAG: hypothetical protein ROW48_13650 [Bellilinea sp.]|jgi:hypothetical protein
MGKKQMEKIFDGNFLTLYSQIGLYDTEDPSSYPSWETGTEALVFSDKGVAVATKGDHLIHVLVFDNPIETGTLFFLGRGKRRVGNRGLTIGNEIAASSDHLDWNEGLTQVEIYGNSPNGEATEVIYVLKYLG